MRSTQISFHNEKESKQIKLAPDQASEVPFPPGCLVTVFDNGRIICTGEVSSVFISFPRDSGCCENLYEIGYRCLDGIFKKDIVKGTKLRYALNCCVEVSPKFFKKSAVENIEGIIRGHELSTTENISDKRHLFFNDFSYSVEVQIHSKDGSTRSFQYHGVGPEFISYQQSINFPHQYLDDEKSIVSFDDANVKDETEKVESYYSKRSNSIGHCTSTNLAEVNSGHKGSGSLKRLEVRSEASRELKSETPTEDVLSTRSLPKKKYPCGQNDMKYLLTQPQLKCDPMTSPVPSKFRGDIDAFKGVAIPAFACLANFPYPHRHNSALVDGMKICVMCGKPRPKKNTPSMKASVTGVNFDAIIPNQNKGLCTHCDVNVWVVRESGLQIKWCKGCKNFKHWAAFGEKGMATKCMLCRERQQEKYAARTKGIRLLTVNRQNKTCGLKRKLDR